MFYLLLSLKSVVMLIGNLTGLAQAIRGVVALVRDIRSGADKIPPEDRKDQ